MKNIFIKLKKQAVLKEDAIRKIVSKDEEDEEESHPLVDAYFQNEEHTDLQSARFVLSLIKEYPLLEAKEKLSSVLVYYTVQLPPAQLSPFLETISSIEQPIFYKVKIFSLIYKSIQDSRLKKWLIVKSIGLIEKEAKISMFSNFVENFDSLISDLDLEANEFAEIYLKLINYLEKHFVYKKLYKHYIVQCLSNISSQYAASAEADSLLLKLLVNGEVSTETVSLAYRQELSSNQYFPFLRQLLLGDFEGFNAADKSSLASSGVKISHLERKIKLQAIPRILSGINQASYSQVSQILKIQNNEVESYIIEAIQAGLLKAKIDEFQQTILIKQLKFRALSQEDVAALQKNVSTLAARLQQIAV